MMAEARPPPQSPGDATGSPTDEEADESTSEGGSQPDVRYCEASVEKLDGRVPLLATRLAGLQGYQYFNIYI